MVMAIVIHDSSSGSGITRTLGGCPYSATKPTARRSTAAIPAITLIKIPNPPFFLRIFTSPPEIDGHIFELYCWILYPQINGINLVANFAVFSPWG